MTDPLPPSGPEEFDQPITSIAQAEQFFRAMRCSPSFMDRYDRPERYREYSALRIPEDIELEWTVREGTQLLQTMINQAGPADGHRIPDLVGYTEGGRFPALLDDALAAARSVEERLGPLGSLVAVEELLGSKRLGQGSGLVETCCDVGRADLANSFALLARHLLEDRVPWVNPGMEERRLAAMARLESVQLLLVGS